MPEYIRCDTCPRCMDTYPGKLDAYGYHFYICGDGGNIVYKEPHKVRRAKGNGWLQFQTSGCGLYKSIEDALEHMTGPEIARYYAAKEGGQEA